MSDTYPLSAIVGQEALVEALLVNAVAPDVGGVLIRGDRGTAKSTAVRALAPLLPPVLAAATERYAFAPGDLSPGGKIPLDADTEERIAAIVDLPIGTTVDRLVGSLDLGQALAGNQSFEAGLLARAHRGILYVDEVNLLPDHLVDALLDAAATGVARVEREAVSSTHDARFLLVGTMNLEEGELRPQLLDRFGLAVDVKTSPDPAQRAEIVRRRLAYREDPAAFCRLWQAAEAELAAKIARARDRLASVELPERELLRITAACAELGIDGARGDIVSATAAKALAALDESAVVEEAHVRRAAQLALLHRRPPEPLGRPDRIDDELARALDDPPEDDPDDPSPPGPDGSNGSGREMNDSGARGDSANLDSLAPGMSPASAEADGFQYAPESPARERRDSAVHAHMPSGVLVLHGTGSGRPGRRARSRGEEAGSIDSVPAGAGDDDLAVVASLRGQLTDGGSARLRRHVRAGREGTLICLVLDASGSMGARSRLARVKGACTELVRSAYVHRDRVAVLSFRDGQARVIVEPCPVNSNVLARIDSLATGGRTPLAQGLRAAGELLQRERRSHPQERSIAVVLTDGRAADDDGEIRAAAARLGRVASAVHIVDIEDGFVRVGIAAEIAAAANGRVHQLEFLVTNPKYPENRKAA
ncbi:MAG: VWA domain-containing protein [Solirubrobacterales bacterium]|nr:VWA domain-containing protein [Solirubrobacterales bacterium]